MATSTPGGYAGKCLRVDLTNRRLTDEVFDADVLRKWVGGSGLGARILYDEVAPGTSWDDPANRLIVASGPLGGTRVMGSGTFSAITKGPLTNGAVTTQANGFLGAFIKFCGYDGLIFQGAADRLVYLYVHDGGAELRDASHLAGKDTWETQEILSAELGRGPAQLSVFSIGPAGEHLAKIASIAGDRGHVAGHNGAGAVMGSKRLKAIAVARGSGRFATAQPQRLTELADQLIERIKTDPASRNTYQWGTSQGFAGAHAGGWLPVRNYTTNVFPQWGDFMGEVVRNTFEIKGHPCWACQMHHCHIMKVTRGPATGYVGEEPEYEQWAAWGPVVGNTDPGLAVQLANEVDRLGFETNETGWLIGWVMECYEKGYLTREQLDGLDMRWGNAEATLALLRKIAHREGIGDLLAHGVKRAAEKLGRGAEKAAMHVKGLEMAADGVRASKGESIVHATSARGADHLRPYASAIDAFGYRDEELGITGDINYLEDGNKGWVKPFQELSMATNMLGVCLFASITLAIKASTWAKLASAAVGRTISKDELLKAAERVINMERQLNARFGFDRKDDTLPERFLKEPAPDGRGEGEVVDLKKNLDSYFESMGWDLNTGLPKRETLERLGLDWML